MYLCVRVHVCTYMFVYINIYVHNVLFVFIKDDQFYIKTSTVCSECNKL